MAGPQRSDNGEPRWDLLPHDPEGFFELESGYDRKDLKRRYNALIRRFKPERHPEEFQRIRAAFEHIDDSLRYGRTYQSPMGFESIASDWAGDGWPGSTGSSHGRAGESDNVDGGAATPAAREPGSARPSAHRPGRSQPGRRGPTPAERTAPASPPALFERLASESPAALYEELSRRADKSAYDYYALALLADVTVPDDPLQFLKWLLAGLKAHPHEPALFLLLQEYFRTPLPAKLVPKLLAAVSTALTDDRFYFLTERLWDRLLRETPFDVFRRTLARCEANLLDYRIEGKLAFYMHILQPALWKADDAWLDAAFSFIEEHYEEIPEHLEYELEITFLLRDYRGMQDEFLDGDPVRAAIDRTLRGYCVLDQQEFDRLFLECQLILAGDGDAVLDAFPVDSGDYNPLYAPWSWISQEVAARVGDDSLPPEPETAVKKVFRLLRRIDDDTSRSLGGHMLSYLGLVYYGLVLLCCGLIAAAPFVLHSLVSDNSPGAALALVYVALILAGIAGFWVWVKDRTLVPFLGRVSWWLGRRRYRRAWRREMLDFLKTTHYPAEDVMTIAERIAESPAGNDLQYVTWLAAFVQRDYGLAFYSTAQRFLK